MQVRQYRVTDFTAAVIGFVKNVPPPPTLTIENGLRVSEHACLHRDQGDVCEKRKIQKGHLTTVAQNQLYQTSSYHIL